MPVTLKETPQSVSVITSEQIRMQNLTTVEAALQSTPGITIFANVGVNNNTIVSRGYTVSTYTVDGGAPMSFSGSGLASGDLSQYDHVEVLKGSAALFGGSGQPGGVVNLQRKRPLDHQQLIVNGQLGAWDYKRGEIDVSTPVAFDGALRTRFDVAWQNNDAFTDFTHQNTWNFYGVVEADLGPDTLLRFGGSYRRVKGRGENFNGLPLFADGQDLGLPVSTNFALPWSYSSLRKNEEFAALEHRFSDGWTFNASGTRVEQKTGSFRPSFASPNIDGAGNGFNYLLDLLSTGKDTQYALDAHLAGGAEIFGRAQKFVLGIDYQDVKTNSDNLNSNLYSGSPYTGLNVFNPNLEQFNIPDVPNRMTSMFVSNTDIRTKQWGIYANLMLEPLAKLHVNGGVRFSNYKYTSISGSYLPSIDYYYESVNQAEADNVANFTGSVVYDVLPDISLYASYADIFAPNANARTVSGSLVPPLSGQTYEAGAKAAFADGKLNASLAFFASDQVNIAVLTTYVEPGCCYAPGAAQRTRGIEAQISGELAKGWSINAGYTYTSSKYNQAALDGGLSGGALPTAINQQPKHQVKIFSTYTPAWLPKVTIQGNFRLDSARFSSGYACPVTITPGSGGICPVFTEPFSFVQPTYAVGDAGIEYAATGNWTISLNVTNFTSTRYYVTNSTSPSNGHFLAEPRRFVFTLRGKY
ncbi:TonB-dependent siderophore receptor [Sphingobium sp. H39-3-25]|uniref:TonB-dependent siderophore receptor n=1 Tax=Sphingobium arseniciresistens TaxID=3030834 RepID=UPI0023B99C90|nr:TonB-dependent siderophore receptor [Sphingobium arseniciresistens]